jgi:hypothetical protein
MLLAFTCCISTLFFILLQVPNSSNDAIHAVSWEAIALVQDGTGRAYMYIDGAQDVCTLMRIQQTERQVCSVRASMYSCLLLRFTLNLFAVSANSARCLIYVYVLHTSLSCGTVHIMDTL